MAKDELFNIEWEGLKELEQQFDNMEKNFQRILVEEYTGYGMLVEEGAQKLAPRDEGELEDKSIKASKAKIKNNEVVVEVGSNSPYALRRHEEPYRSGSHPKYSKGAKFENYYQDGRGRATRAKPSWRGYQPGRKYLENAVLATEEDYDEMNARILERTLGDKK